MSEYLPFTNEFVLAIASDYDTPEKICIAHNVTEDDWERLRTYTPFVEAVAAMVKQLKENGITANFKAKIAVEDAIPAVSDLIHDSEAPHQSRVAAFQSLQKLAGFEGNQGGGGQGGFQVNINLNGGESPQPTLEVTPIQELAQLEN